MKTVCCLCGRRKKNDHIWISEPPLAPGEPVSHGYCPDCFRLMMTRTVRRRAERTLAATMAAVRETELPAQND